MTHERQENSKVTSKRGMEFIRRLDEDEASLLRGSFAACQPGMPAGTRAIHWVNLYLNGQLTVPHPLQRALHDWVTRLVAEVYSDWPAVHLVTYSFIVNPAGNQDGQPFHCDYAGTAEDILEAEGWDAIEVAQIVPRPFTLLRLLPGTPHRGIGNGADYDRLMFCVTVDDHPYELAESVYFKYSSREHEPISEG
jgi:hypothetical protein